MNKIELVDSVKKFLAEDIGQGDVTGEAIFAPDQIGHAVFIAKESFVTCGMETVAMQVFKTKNPAVTLTKATPDGNHAAPGDIVFAATGPILDLLGAERVALNLVQRLCGIATLTAKFTGKVKDLPVRIVDTRKTTPGLRALEKYAVRTGGGQNHRYNLADAVLIKDNHIIGAGSITEAVTRVREHIPHTMKIEVEAETLEQVQECLACNVEIIMLDNMDCDTMRKAVVLAKGKAILEASGGVNLENVREIAETGVDIISVGGLTHSAPACDISMKIES